MTQRKADFYFYLLLISLSVLQLGLIYFSPLSLAPDETHYWEWSRRLDLSYYSKGPLIAYLIRFGTTIFGDTALGVRSPAFICYFLFSILFYYFARNILLPFQALGAFVLIRLMMIFVQTGTLMTTDAPVILFTLLAIISWYFAVVEERKNYWILFGLMLGVGGLAKYTIVFLFPAAALFLLLTPGKRKDLISKEFIFGFVVLALTLSPIFIWNMKHNWVNFEHNVGHVVKAEKPKFALMYFFELLGGQLALVGPFIFWGICLSFYRGIKLWLKGDFKAGVFLFASLPLFVFVFFISLTKRVYANWPLPVYVGAALLLFYLIYKGEFFEEKLKKFGKWSLYFSLFILAGAYLPFMGLTLGFPGKALPTKKLFGWKELAQKVQEQLPKIGENGFIFTDYYGLTSELAFYVKPTPDVYCANVDGRRMNQYDVWAGYELLKGKDGLIVVDDVEKIQKLEKDFDSIEPLGESPAYVVNYSNDILRSYYIFLGKNYSGRGFELPVDR